MRIRSFSPMEVHPTYQRHGIGAALYKKIIESLAMKRFYACHCPWARGSLRRGEMPVSARFYQCSAGFHKESWEVIFGIPLRAGVLESALQGDIRCRFAIHLPEDAVRKDC